MSVVADIVADAYAQLSPPIRLALLRTFVSDIENAPDSIAALTVGRAIRDLIDACLETIAVLGDESASTLVKLALSDHGLDGNDLAAFRGRHDMVANLWIRDPDHAKQVLNWFHANIKIRRRDRIEVFRIPRIGPWAMPDDLGETRLQALVEKVLLDSLQASDIREFKVSRRPSPWPGDEESTLIQVDIKRSRDPEKVEIDEDGTILVKSLRFIAANSVVVDPGRGAIYVMSDQNPRKLRDNLAMAVLQHFFGEGAEPGKIPKMPVHPAKLDRRPAFEPARSVLVSDVSVCELHYRDLSEPHVRRSLIGERHDADLYTLTDFTSSKAGRTVYRAGLCFGFRDRYAIVRPKTMYLEHPNKLTFPYFTPQQQTAAEDFLIRNGLLDPNPYQGQAGPFDLLAEATSDVPARWIEAELGPKWTTALSGIGALTHGAMDECVYCPPCNRRHSLEHDQMRPDQLIVACPDDPRPATQADRETRRFMPHRLAAWLAGELGTDVAHPLEIGVGLWDLGVTGTAGKKDRVSLILVTSLVDDERLKKAVERVIASATRPRGLVLSLSSRHHRLPLPNGWKVAALSGLLDVDAGKLIAPKDGPHLIMSGRRSRKPAHSKDRWPELFTAYEALRGQGLGSHIAADRLLAIPDANWSWKRDTIAKKLRKKFPEDFPNG